MEEAKVTSYKRVDFNIIISVIFIAMFGILILYSSNRDYAVLMEQAKYVGAGIVIMLVMSLISKRFDYQKVKRISILGYPASIIMIFLLTIPQISVESHGATRWIKILGVSIQVAEVVKVFMIFFIAYYVSKNVIELRRPLGVWKLWILVGIIAFMILTISSNLSSCLILLMITFCITFIASDTPKMHLLILGGAVLCIVLLCTYLLANLPTAAELTEIEKDNYQLARIIAWLAPERYDSDHSFQILQGLYAFGSGGFTGKGLGQSAQRDILPEASNDMILCILAEEMGLLGVALLIVLYVYLFFQMAMIVYNVKNIFGRMLCAGVLFHFAFQALVNMAVATSLIPNTGVTLPFVSAGGTATLLYFFQVGIVLYVYKREMKPFTGKEKEQDEKKG